MLRRQRGLLLRMGYGGQAINNRTRHLSGGVCRRSPSAKVEAVAGYGRKDVRQGRRTLHAGGCLEGVDLEVGMDDMDLVDGMEGAQTG